MKMPPDDASPGPLDERSRLIIVWAFARLDVAAFATASACVFAFGLFVLTLLLVLKGAPPGIAIGPHLGVLAAYLPGYSVSASGALIGAVYAGVIGAALGLLLAITWNLAHALLLALIRVRATLAAYSMD
jgi:hypothetical protein